MKRCTKCKEEKDRGEFSPDERKSDGLYSRCKSCRREDRRTHYAVSSEKVKAGQKDWVSRNRGRCLAVTNRWRKKNPFAVKLQQSRNAAKRRSYMPCTATAEELKASFTGRCGICGVPELECSLKLALDHDHETGEFRGWLCGKCNKALGLFNDNEELLVDALHYLMQGEVK